MLINFEKIPHKSKRVVSNTLEIPLNASRIRETFKGGLTRACSGSYTCLLKVSQIILDNLFFAFFSPKYGLLYVLGLFNGILHFEFGEKLYELYSNEGFKSTYFI
jgi:hypothetical protein